MAVRNMSPALKWAGGKKQLLDQIHAAIPSEYNTYYEPFIGGGAVLLGLSPAKACINDRNQQLINLYTQLTIAPERVIALLNAMDAVPCTKEFYYAKRAAYNAKISAHRLDAECAALMIWINKHCFNGLYRVNGKGLFNVPYNNKVQGKSIDEENIRAISKYLRTADITMTCLDFEQACASVRAGDFVYFDSPYVPKSLTASFTDYTTDGFGEEDHIRLAALFRRLDSIGAKLMLSNNDVPLVHELYEGYTIRPLEVRRAINRDASKRTSTEVIIMNY